MPTPQSPTPTLTRSEDYQDMCKHSELVNDVCIRCEKKIISCHDHGNCELCDSLENQHAALQAENAELRGAARALTTAMLKGETIKQGHPLHVALMEAISHA